MSKHSVSSASLAVTLLVISAPAFGAGFSIFEQGAKAMGMAGAFTAQADDPSALFHNVGGLAFFDRREVSVGATLITSTDEEFVGRGPGPGAGSRGSLVSLEEPVPHLYWVQPVGERWNFGLAINSPFGLKTEWENPDTFAGRFINTKASLLVIDVNPNVGYAVSDELGIGFGLIVRMSEVELNRRLAANLAPFGSVEFAAARLESDMDRGYGWQVGLLHRYSNSFSWGFAYRSKVTVDYAGDGRFTQISTGNPGLDAFLAATVPFGQPLPVETGIEFPDTASLGAAIALGKTTLLELDVNWAGWSSFDRLRIDFPGNPAFNVERIEDWSDVTHYRLGLLLGRGTGAEWRFGFVIDPSPQPTASVSPLLPDSDRKGYTVGWGHEGDKVGIDLALMYLDFDSRLNDVSRDGFNGTYSQTGWLLASTISF